MNETTFFGTAVVDWTAETDGASRWDSDEVKQECRDIGITVGGCPPNAGREYALDASAAPLLAAITGADPLGNLLSDLLRREFAQYRRICTASQSRVSLVIPHPCRPDGGKKIYTVRPQIDDAATLAAVQPLLKNDRRLLIGSMRAEDADLVEQLIGSHNRDTYLMLTRNQIVDRDRTLELARQAAYVQMNDEELEDLTGSPGDPVDGINALRDEGVASMIVTAGERGIFAFTRGQWWHAPAFDVEVVSDVGAGDTVAGAILAGLDLGKPFDEILRCASAAAAMHVSRTPRQGGWAELVAFVRSTPTHSLVPKVKRKPRREPSFNLQSRMVPSTDPVASWRLSGENAIVLISRV